MTAEPLPVRDDAPPPRAADQGGDPTGGAAFTLARGWDTTWRLFRTHWGPLTLYALCIVAVQVVSQFVPFAGLILLLYGGTVLTASTGHALINAERRGERLDLSQMFHLFASIRSLEVVLIGLLVGIVVTIPMLLVFVGMIIIIAVLAQGGGQYEWMAWTSGITLTMVGVLVGLILQIRFSLAHLLCVDSPDGGRFDVFGPLGESWRLTAGSTFALLGLWIALSAIATASILALCIGYVLVAMQLMLSLNVATYFLLLPVPRRGGVFSDIATCPWCSYDLTATDGPQCPECGRLHPGRMPQEPSGVSNATDPSAAGLA